MRVSFHKHFDKSFSKLPSKVQIKAIDRIEIFRTEPFAKILDNHPLSGKFADLRSIDITGDYRALYEPISTEVALFVDIGTHSQLYG